MNSSFNNSYPEPNSHFGYLNTTFSEGFSENYLHFEKFHQFKHLNPLKNLKQWKEMRLHVYNRITSR